MATLAQIQAKSSGTLTAIERVKVREVFGFKATLGTAESTDLEAAINALTGEKNQFARAYLDDWDRVPVQPVKQASTSRKGIEYDQAKHKLEVSNRLRLLLGYDTITETEAGVNSNSIQMVSITLGSLYSSSEY